MFSHKILSDEEKNNVISNLFVVMIVNFPSSQIHYVSTGLLDDPRETIREVLLHLEDNPSKSLALDSNVQ